MVGNLQKQSEREDRGVSEVVAFVLVFAVILVSVGLLYVTAFQSMHSYQEGEQVKSAAQGMESLTSNFDDVTRQGGVESRSGELALRDGSMRLEGGSNAKITVDGTVVFDGHMGALTYQYGSSTISYEGGALFQGANGDDDRTAMTGQPAFSCNGDRAVVSLTVLIGEERSIQTSGNHRFTLVQERTESHTGEDVSIDASGAYGSTWTDFLEGGWSSDCNASTVVVRIVWATVEF